MSTDETKHTVIFVLGGPGAGKGTQCARLVADSAEGKLNATIHHLSAGDLLRAARKEGGEIGDLINSKIAAGQIVPSSITVGLLRTAMVEACDKAEADDKKKNVFLVDGFPRSIENVNVWDEIFASEPAFAVGCVLFFDCSEETMTSRLVERGQTSGRVDDNLETIKKRFRTFREESYPIVELYESGTRNDGVTVKRVRADRPVEAVYTDVLKAVHPTLLKLN